MAPLPVSLDRLESRADDRIARCGGIIHLGLGSLAELANSG
jgi:hypothetical protein